MERQARVAHNESEFGRVKKAATRVYLEQIVPEALGLQAAANADATVLYEASAEELAAA